MKVNELRKGNLVLLSVNWKDNIHSVDEIYTDEIKVTSIEDGACFPRMIMRSVNPIPLTPQWLERCGFDYHMPYYIYEAFIVSENRIRDGSGDYDGFQMKVRIEDRIIPTVIRSLHQLQNLYFVLTGEEIQIKMP